MHLGFSNPFLYLQVGLGRSDLVPTLAQKINKNKKRRIEMGRKGELGLN